MRGLDTKKLRLPTPDGSRASRRANGRCTTATPRRCSRAARQPSSPGSRAWAGRRRRRAGRGRAPPPGQGAAACQCRQPGEARGGATPRPARGRLRRQDGRTAPPRPALTAPRRRRLRAPGAAQGRGPGGGRGAAAGGAASGLPPAGGARPGRRPGGGGGKGAPLRLRLAAGNVCARVCDGVTNPRPAPAPRDAAH